MEMKKCDVCGNKNRSALKINGVEFCHSCLKFFQNLVKINERKQMEEIEKQTAYIDLIKNNFIKETSSKDIVTFKERKENTSVC